MLDCLPSASEWSPQSQYLMLLNHIDTLRHHLEGLESAAGEGLQSLIAAGPHLLELNACCLDAHELLKLLASQPVEVLQELEQVAC